jgi:hypothetical protein
MAFGEPLQQFQIDGGTPGIPGTLGKSRTLRTLGSLGIPQNFDVPR